jgi:AraC family transcriptional activator of pobA
MDVRIRNLYFSTMIKHRRRQGGMPAAPGRTAVPVYDLYGETRPWAAPEILHCEPIAERSARHHWAIRPHRHDRLFQILFLRSGDAEIALDTIHRQGRGPLAVLVPARAVHGFAFSPDVDGHVITLPDSAVARLAPLSGNAGTWREADVVDLASLPERQPEVDRLVAAVAREFLGAEAGRGRMLESLASQLLVTLCRCRADTERDRTEPRQLKSESRVSRFYGLVEEYYRSGRPVAAYAARLGISSVQLNRSLQTSVGKSALAVIHDRLILEAKRNLLYTGLSVSGIAELLGFEDAAYFSRFFSRHVGRSPRRFRSAALQSMQ